jgi:hypothetical protein
MNLQTGTIELTGLSSEVLLNLDQRARAAGVSVENFLCTWIEQEYTKLIFTPEEIEELRAAAQRGRDQIAQGQCRRYANADELMDDIEAEVAKRRAARKSGTTL